ncbi:hypothetical protein Fmac_004175 [Flemingia macrophylla]|uniref:Uncharacterized protein n=1 Tax=Flemingia macrophylla TaxID=520843 RepID=A0ABD1N6T8_9FABA
MAVVAVSHSSAPQTFNSPSLLKFPSSPISVSFPIHHSNSTIFCRANSPTGPVKSKSKKKKRKGNEHVHFPQTSDSSMPLPEPPFGFVLDHTGNVIHASTNRLLTVVDPMNNLPLECVIRRQFKSSERDECMLLCPVDTPVQILKSTKVDGWSAISDEEVESILPDAAYALAKIHMHLVYSGYCYTARGGFCYTEEDIFDFHTGKDFLVAFSLKTILILRPENNVGCFYHFTDDGKGVDGLPTEGVQITSFNLEDAQYMIYTPSDPLLFVAVKGEDEMLSIADDDLLDDPAVIDAIDEEIEFNALAITFYTFRSKTVQSFYLSVYPLECHGLALLQISGDAG